MATLDKNFIVKNGLTVEGSTIISPAATTSFASLRIPHGTAPASPNNGDIWSTSAGVFARVNGVTVGPLGTGGGGGGGYFFSSTVPVSPSPGDIWINADTGVEYTYVDDGTDPVWANMSSGNYVGPQGEDSTVPGPQGPQGYSVLNGIVDPTTQGINGDFYINTANNKIFGPKAAGVWPVGVSLVGPQGPQGPAGGAITFIVDGGGTVITTGVKGYVEIPFACTITKWTVLNDVSGSITFDIWKDTYANYPPTVADTITAAAKPLTSAAVKGQSSTLTGWTTSLAAGDILAFNVDSATTVKSSTIILSISKV